MESFRGVIGGKPQKALYFLGRHNQDYIYLDPHYVQNAKK
jgi:cysteine protease ATG4